MKQAMRGKLGIVHDELQSIELFIIDNLVFSLIPSKDALLLRFGKSTFSARRRTN